MEHTMFTRLYPPSEGPGGAPLWAIFRGADLVTIPASPALLERIDGLPIDTGAALLIGAIGDRPVRAAEIPGDALLPDGLAAMTLRDLLASADPALVNTADYAIQLLRWMKANRYCPSCGQPLALADGWGVRCAACSHTSYPPVSPAIIVLIHDGERALLTTKAGWGKRYSLVAGFVEPGETFEECVAREVREEVGVEVGELRYLESQSWPFPHQIMVGFLARYAGGEIAIDTTELADARWFSRDDLPELPPPYTISRRIINRWLAEG
jgi:NAD+ diphosphatase